MISRNSETVKIRPAAIDDAEQILDIYSYYVKNTAITFEYDVPGIADFRKRIAKTLDFYPYFVAVSDGKMLGYAYAGPFVGRAAYAHSAELTIYVANDAKRNGVGRKLYEALEQALKSMGIINLYACVGYPDTDDEYLSKNSAEFHEHMGFAVVGKFHNCGKKFGRWYSMIWMEKLIGEHKDNTGQVKKFSTFNFQ